MRLGSSLGLALFCWLLGEAAAYNPWGFLRGEAELWGAPAVGQPPNFSPWAWVDVSQLQAAAPLHPVAVQCQEAQVVLTVHRDLFGTGRLVRAGDLTLGTAACPPTAQNAAENVVTFVAGLHECGSTLRVTPDALIYSTTLNYSPLHAGNPIIIRTSPAVVPIECHYPRRSNVSSSAIKPTWAPFHSTMASEQKLLFSLRLMSDDWSAERASAVFQLGEVLHFQAGVDAENHAPLRLFVDSCVATPAPERGSSPQYAFIDFSGCLVDGQLDDATSAFVSPRPRPDVLQFAVEAFKFAADSSSLIYITCHLKASLADRAPDALNKACSFDKASSLWVPVEGPRDVCSCCEARRCPSGGLSRRLQAPSRWQGGRSRRDLSSQPDPVVEEEDVVLGPLLIHSWQHPTRGRTPSGAAGGHLGLVLGLAAIFGLVILILAALGALTACHRPSNAV
ncbi:zona pellucida sperm-binding protein 3 [Anas platyrhynchos]|uniref:zona pellucida sperm-binding protein 3 n=1 Tax=Anas platyrhynchos TaxID=8839 RepID=UPI000350D8A4|nr:zona pellucida sperm-binding protein 3 [Anas platyrhynchos]